MRKLKELFRGGHESQKGTFRNQSVFQLGGLPTTIRGGRELGLSAPRGLRNFVVQQGCAVLGLRRKRAKVQPSDAAFESNRKILQKGGRGKRIVGEKKKKKKSVISPDRSIFVKPTGLVD